MSFTVQAEPAPVQFSFFDFNAPKNDEVEGIHFPAIYGKTGSVTGVDFQLLAISEMDNMKGVAFAFPFVGATIINNEMTGVTLGIFGWHKGQDTGVNVNAVNMTNNVNGLNWGFVNYSTGFTVADVGVVSISKKSNFQLSIFNSTNDLQGLQIGLLNHAENGFLPWFPFFNFNFSD
jgi:hypothetical protein